MPAKGETVAVILTTLPNMQTQGTTVTLPCKTMSSRTFPNSFLTGESSTIVTTANQNQTVTTTIQNAQLPTGLNIANLSMAPGQNLRLHNLVQLTNVNGVAQSIAVPISLTMMQGSSSSGITTQAIMGHSGQMIMGIDGSKGMEGQQVMLMDTSGHTLGDGSGNSGNSPFTGAVLMQATPTMTMSGATGSVLQLPMGMHSITNLQQLLAGGTLKTVQGQAGANISILQMSPAQAAHLSKHQTQVGQLQVIRPLPANMSGGHSITTLNPNEMAAALQGQQLGVQIQPAKPNMLGGGNHHQQQQQQMQFVMQQQPIMQQATAQQVQMNQAKKKVVRGGRGKTC